MRYLFVVLCILFAGSLLGSGFAKIEVPTVARINKIYFEDPFYGWAVTSAGEMLSTTDGGKTWKIKKVGARGIADIVIKGRQGYLTGDRGLLMKSTDRGATWQDLSLSMKFNFVGVGITSDSSIMVCGNDQNSMSKTNGESFISWDYGKTWKKRGHLGNGYTDLVTQPPRRVYLLAAKKTFFAMDGGWYFWTGEYTGSRMGFGFDFLKDYGYLVGSKGLFSATTDGGRNWTEVPLEITKNLYAVTMFDNASGLAIGQDGLLLYFADSGKAHTVGDCGFKVDLRTICVTEDKIFLGGDNGTLLYRNRK